jgi:hypothetical protein
VALTIQPAVQLEDAFGNSVMTPGVAVTASIASGSGSLTSATATTDASGTAKFNGLTITGVAGSFVLRFTAPNYTPVSSGSLLLSAGAVAQVVVTPSPASVVTGATQQFTAVGKDASNNVVTFTPQWAVVSQGGTIDGAGLFTAGTVASTFTNTVRATSNSISGFATVTVVPGPPAVLVPATPPSSSATSGLPLATQPAIQLRDIHGNAVAVAGVTITAAIADGTGSLSNSQATTDASGIARFSGLTITGAAGSFVLRFEAPSYLPATSGPIVVGAGVASRLIVISGITSPGQSGVVFSTPTMIQLADAQGNPVAKANVPITASIVSGGGTLGGPLTANTNATGIAIFAGLKVTGIAGPRTLSFSSPGLAGAFFGPFAVGAGSGALLAFTTPPSATAKSGVPLLNQPVVRLMDSSGNAVTTAGVVVTVTIATGNGTLTGATTTTVAGGTATFSGLTINGTAGTVTLNFKSPGYATLSSGQIVLSLVAR